MANAANNKDTIYVDIDDEITTIIDKVQGSNAKVVALVLPKRASVFQSIVNMKLLKRAAERDSKNVVLVTTETALLPLAGSVGLHVAPTPQSRPAVPAVADQAAIGTIPEDAVTMEDEEEPSYTAGNAANKSVGELAAASGIAVGSSDAIETIAMEDEPVAAGTPSDSASKPKAHKKNKKLAIPNFEKFRLWLFLGGAALILLVVGLYFGLTVLPKATVAITTDSSTVDINLPLTLDSKVKDFVATSTVLPATIAKIPKTSSQQVPATGQADKGTRASGQIKITNCDKNSDDGITITAGTGFSANGKTYISQNDVTVPQSNFTGLGSCKKDGTSTVNVVAQKVGESYNADATNYVIASAPSTVTGAGSAMTGGTTNIVKVVAQKDIDDASAQLKTQAGDTVKGDLSKQLKQDDLFAVSSTFSAGTPQITASSQVGDQADTVTITQVTTYTMFGIDKDNLSTLIANAVKKQIDTSKQEILDDGVSTAKFQVVNLGTDQAAITVGATAKAGPHLDIANLRQTVAGQKSGEVQANLKKNPGIKDVQVQLSPFWVSAIPKKQAKITIVIDNVVQPAATSTK